MDDLDEGPFGEAEKSAKLEGTRVKYVCRVETLTQ